jgi:hypothetical protein
MVENVISPTESIIDFSDASPFNINALPNIVTLMIMDAAFVSVFPSTVLGAVLSILSATASIR